MTHTIASVRLCILLAVLLCVSQAQKIKHVIVLMEENRSFDHMFGWYPGVNGLTGKEFNLVNTSDTKSQHVFVDKIEPMVAPCDPDHTTGATTYKIFGADAISKNNTSNATMSGFVEWENLRGNMGTNYCDVMSMLTPEHVPIISTLAQNFVLMDRFFAAHAGPTWPNRIFTLSGTSAGLDETGPWYHNVNGQLFPQKTIFDQVDSEGMVWKNYYNDTPWELFMQSISHNPEHVISMEQFFADARDGNLPNFAWINPRSGINVTTMQGSNDHHPDHDISLGEQYYKDIYEALRASPQWNETLFIITYDEHGGYFDHEPTPLNVPPPGDGETSYPDSDILFNRLGIRIPTLLISPWVPKGVILSGPPDAQKPAPNSEYTLTSIIATARKLLGMQSGPLTKRDAWSATFEQMLSEPTPRTDCPMHLPDALPPSPSFSPESETNAPVNDLQKHIMTVHAHLAGVEYPHHIEHQGKMSDWAQQHFHKHKEHTLKWKKSKTTPNYDLVLRPKTDPAYKTMPAAWWVNKGQIANFMTISLRNVSKGVDLNLCFDYGVAIEGSKVGVSSCYPSANPDNNRDQSQQWIWSGDSTIRPASNQNLCLTNVFMEFNGDQHVYLQPCSGDVSQHWAYHGPSSGNDDYGWIYFGDYTNALGLVQTGK